MGGHVAQLAGQGRVSHEIKFRTLSCQVLKASKDSNCTPSRGSLCWWFVISTVEGFSLSLVGTFPVSVCLSSVPPAAHLSKGPGTIFSTWQRRRGQAAVRSPMAVSPHTEVAPVDPRTGVPRVNVVSRSLTHALGSPG